MADEQLEAQQVARDVQQAEQPVAQPAEQRDMIDELMDLEKSIQSVQNPLNSLTSVLLEDPSKRPVWNPGNYKEKPRANSMRCIRCMQESRSECAACVDVCPVDAISFEGQTVRVSDDCRKCGLCLAVCPTEVFSERLHQPKKLYDQIARTAAAHETCYLTCTRALGRLPEANEVVLPCVGALAPEVLFSVLTEYPNIYVYLPEGICDRCQTTTGEGVMFEHIARAEEWSGRAVGIALGEDELNHAKKRSYERSEFMRRTMNAGMTAAMGLANPALAGAQAVAKRIADHTARINALERQLDQIVGSSTSQKKRRTLTQRRQLLLGALQKRPQLASGLGLTVPTCEPALCTLCGTCVRVCPTNACDLDASGRFSVATSYCLGCASCVDACSEDALSMVDAPVEELVVPEGETLNAAEQKDRVANVLDTLKQEAINKLEAGIQAVGAQVSTQAESTEQINAQAGSESADIQVEQEG